MKTILLSVFASMLFMNISAADSNASSSISSSTSASGAALSLLNTAILSGKISDKLTGESLAGVEIQLMDTELKTYSDFDGNFTFENVGPGAHALKIDFISYSNVVENVYVEKLGKPINIKLASIEK